MNVRECPLREDCIADADKLARAFSDAGDAIAERNRLRHEIRRAEERIARLVEALRSLGHGDVADVAETGR
jgi:hypothetical protein